MGRSPLFTFDKVEFPLEKPACAAELETLRVGQRVRITCDDSESKYNTRVHRTPSTYGCESSHYHNTELIVDNINVEPDLNKYGVRAIAFRDPSISKDNHIYTWYVTTDGYVRESEHFCITEILMTVELLL